MIIISTLNNKFKQLEVKIKFLALMLKLIVLAGASAQQLAIDLKNT